MNNQEVNSNSSGPETLRLSPRVGFIINWLADAAQPVALLALIYSRKTASRNGSFLKPLHACAGYVRLCSRKVGVSKTDKIPDPTERSSLWGNIVYKTSINKQDACRWGNVKEDEWDSGLHRGACVLGATIYIG